MEQIQLEKLTFLIAEDDEGMEFLLSETVEDFSKKTLIAHNGLEAVDIFNANPDIDLILMDIRMPIMDGYEATSEIRKLNKNIPIFAQTSCMAPFEKEKAMDAGCDEYIQKPINSFLLKELLQKYFQK